MILILRLVISKSFKAATSVCLVLMRGVQNFAGVPSSPSGYEHSYWPRPRWPFFIRCAQSGIQLAVRWDLGFTRGRVMQPWILNY